MGYPGRAVHCYGGKRDSLDLIYWGITYWTIYYEFYIIHIMKSHLKS